MKFRYDTSAEPSAPFIELVVESRFGRSSAERGKIDTGSDITVIPDRLIRRLDLRATYNVKTASMHGEGPSKLYVVSVTIGTYKFSPLYVISMERDDVLVGRDLINLWDTRLDGMSETCEIVPWSTYSQVPGADSP